jgi:hypothetical protein
MFDLSGRTIGYLGDLPPRAFLGALLVALVISSATAGIYRRLAGRRSDASMLLVCLVLLANLACILATVVFIESTVPTVRVIERDDRRPRDRVIDLHDHVAPPDAPLASGEPSARRPG